MQGGESIRAESSPPAMPPALTDGAAAVVVISGAAMRCLGLMPRARIVACATVGVEPTLMGLGPVEASRPTLALAGWRAGNLDLIEINESFAAIAVAVDRQMGPI
jgi:acetyl-CoA C-acetyltransferase